MSLHVGGKCGLLLQAWWAEPDAESTGEMLARASQPPGHRDMLSRHPTTAFAKRYSSGAGHDWRGGGVAP